MQKSLKDISTEDLKKKFTAEVESYAKKIESISIAIGAILLQKQEIMGITYELVNRGVISKEEGEAIAPSLNPGGILEK